MSELPLFPSCEQIISETVPAFCAKNTLQRKSELSGTVYWTKFLSVFQNFTEWLAWLKTGVFYSVSICFGMRKLLDQ